MYCDNRCENLCLRLNRWKPLCMGLFIAEALVYYSSSSMACHMCCSNRRVLCERSRRWYNAIMELSNWDVHSENKTAFRLDYLYCYYQRRPMYQRLTGFDFTLLILLSPVCFGRTARRFPTTSRRGRKRGVAANSHTQWGDTLQIICPLML